MDKSILKAIAGAALVLALGAMPALAIDTGGDTTTAAPAGPSLADARADIAAKKWTAAIDKLKLIVTADNSSADAYNLLGYAYRNAGNYDLAGRAYAKALKLDPKHTGALEYQGILFVKLGQIDKAKANLAKIKTISGTGSEAYGDLAKAIG